MFVRVSNSYGIRPCATKVKAPRMLKHPDSYHHGNRLSPRAKKFSRNDIVAVVDRDQVYQAS